MQWICTTFITGIVFAIGWNFGFVVFDYIKEIITEAPNGIRKIRRYKRKKRRMKHEENYYLD